MLTRKPRSEAAASSVQLGNLGGHGSSQVYPKPQTELHDGKPAPDAYAPPRNMEDVGGIYANRMTTVVPGIPLHRLMGDYAKRDPEEAASDVSDANLGFITLGAAIPSRRLF